MESSEDDAGSATSATRGAVARESEPEQMEDVNATPEALPLQDTSELAMAEDNLDGVSVSSPSPHDGNTSTEAILDMIDEFVDGPGAPKRLPLEEVLPVPAPAPYVFTAAAADLAEYSEMTPTTDQDMLNTLNKDTTDQQVDCSDHPDFSNLASTALPADSEQNVIGSCQEDVATIGTHGSTVVESPSLALSTDQPAPEIATPVINTDEVVEPNTSENHNREQSCMPCEEIAKATELPVQSEKTQEKVVLEPAMDAAAESAPEEVSMGNDVNIEIPTVPTLKLTTEKVHNTDQQMAQKVPNSELLTVPGKNYQDIQVPQIILPVTSESEEKVPVSVDKNIKPIQSLDTDTKTLKAEEHDACGSKNVEEAPKQMLTLTLEKQQVELSSLITNQTNISESQISKQTLPSSEENSDKVDNVTVKSAQTIASIPSTKSPLKRKLVRPPRTEPAPSPSVHPQTNAHPNKSELPFQKDVVHRSNTNINTEEDKAVNQPNINKIREPETIVTPRKIRLIRNKANPIAAPGVNMVGSQPEPVQQSLPRLQTITEISKPVMNSNMENCVSPIVCSSKTTEKDKLATSTKEVDESKIIKLDHNQKPVTENLQLADVAVNPTTTCIPAKPEANEHVEIKKGDNVEQRKVPPIKLNISPANVTANNPIIGKEKSNESLISFSESAEIEKQVPKLTIKLGAIADDTKPSVPKLTIKPLQSPVETCDNSIKEIKSQIANITKLNIKPIPKRPDKVNDLHRKSSSSEISESEGSENDDSSASVSDQTSASDHGPLGIVPKVTIKLGKPGTESEGMFYTEKQNIPNQCEESEAGSKIKLKVTQVEDKHERIPKLTIKPVSKCESQPHSPKLTIKPLKPPDFDKELLLEHCETQQIPKLKITQESLSPKENAHKPKITIKPVLKTDVDTITKTSKKSTNKGDDDHIPVVTKLNIKPVLKPTISAEISEVEVPVVSKLNIKPIIKPKDSEENSVGDDIPRVMKLTIKSIKNPEANSSETLTCVESSTDCENKTIPVVTKINIKPIIKPVDEDASKDSENQSSETGTSSDDNSDSVPVVTKLNIKPIVKPAGSDSVTVRCNISEDVNIPVVTKLNIKPIIKPEENLLLNRNLCEQKSPGSIPVVTKLNIKPILKPEESESKLKDHSEETKNPSLVMKFNIKAMAENSTADTDSYKSNSIDHGLGKSLSVNIPVVPKVSIKQLVKSAISKEALSPRTKSTEPMVSPTTRDRKQGRNHVHASPEINSEHQHDRTPDLLLAKAQISEEPKQELESRLYKSVEIEKANVVRTTRSVTENKLSRSNEFKTDYHNDKMQRDHPVTQNLSAAGCTLLKRLLEENPMKKVEDNPDLERAEESKIKENDVGYKNNVIDSVENSRNSEEQSSDVDYDLFSASTLNAYTTQVISSEDESKDLEKPLEINTTDKVASSGQDSPRIILKINKTDHGASSEIITEDMTKHDDAKQTPENISFDKNLKKLPNSKKKSPVDTPISTEGKRLRSCRIVQEPSPAAKRGPGKRNTAALLKTKTTDTTKGTEMSVLESKRLKLGQILSSKSMIISPIAEKVANVSQEIQTDNTTDQIHNSIFNDSRSKNGNSKLHKILSNLQAKQMQSATHNDVNCTDLNKIHLPELDSTTTSTGSSDVVEIVPIENSRPKVQEMIINESSTSRDFNLVNDESARDPLGEPEPSAGLREEVPVPSTPQPKKRGRPRKLPASEGAKPAAAPELPTPALQQRPQRSLRLSRDRPAILTKPRGRGRGGGRGAKRSIAEVEQPSQSVDTTLFSPEQKLEDIDPTSSRIKLPRMTEVLDKTTSQCSTPLSSRRRSSLVGDMKTFSETAELKVVLDPIPNFEEVMKSPEAGRGGRGGRGSRGGRGRPAGRSPRGRGRGRGGGRGAVYMKETMGIYGRVCGPATTTVQLFEEETCMMDDNATPAKPSHLLDEDSQSSVKSSTNDSSKHKKSKFVDLFDSNKVWTAADVKEYTWPPAEPRSEPHVMMIQEQVAMFLGVKGFKRRYPELKRRPVGGDERDYVLRMGIVTEALCDLGITAVDASEVLDIMLSDYPHKYEEYRAHQRARQTAPDRDPPPERIDRIEMKPQPPDSRPEPPKVDPEKLRQEMAAAAIASASEYNSRLNASRRPACVDLQSLTVHRRRAQPPPPPARAHVSPPAGLYPHALLPGQYQHWYRSYTPEELRYFPLNTAIMAPPAPESPAVSESELESEWGSSSEEEDSDNERSQGAKRRKLSKDFSGLFSAGSSSGLGAGEPTCRACGLREEANRKHSNERFLACAQCHAKLHPSCVELGADTIRKCREYAWQCAECKTCCGCRQPADDDKMLFCDLCDRGFHIYCVGLGKVPSGRWHCVECAVCKSCGARSAAGLAGAAGGSGEGDGTPPPAVAPEWQHQSKRGPGGHKVYSHSLCAPCASKMKTGQRQYVNTKTFQLEEKSRDADKKAYRIGRYCPLCDRSFIGPKGTMQLVICKLCDRQLHQECVKQTVSCLNVLDYTCGECRRGGITSRAAAARLAPRTIATLFMAKRRFNKYAHRQYLQSRQLEQAAAKPEDELDADADADAEAEPDAEEESDPLAPDVDEDTADEVVTVEDSTAGEDTAPEDEDETAAAVKALQMDFD